VRALEAAEGCLESQVRLQLSHARYRSIGVLAAPPHVFEHSLASFVFQPDLSPGAFSAIAVKHGESATMLVYCWQIEGEGSDHMAADWNIGRK